MKIKNHLIIPLLFISIGFSQRPERNEIISERHSNGLKKLVNVFEGTGLNETLVGKYGFYDDGVKSFIEVYSNNKKHGKSISWNNEGSVIVEGNYENGRMNGLWKWYYENGQPQKEESYKGGNRISKKCWNEDGDEIEE